MHFGGTMKMVRKYEEDEALWWHYKGSEATRSHFGAMRHFGCKRWCGTKKSLRGSEELWTNFEGTMEVKRWKDPTH